MRICRRHFGVVVLCSSLSLIGARALADELPDSEVNPQTSDIESVASVDNSGNRDIRYVVDPGQGGPKTIEVLTTSTSDDLSPRIGIEPDGDSWLTWWRDGATDEVLFRGRDHSTGTWSNESVVSSTGEDSRSPALVLDPNSAWIAYEIETSIGTDIAVVPLELDDPLPFPGRVIVDSTSYGGDVDVTLHAEAGRLWLTWVNSGDEAAWSEFDYSTDSWSATDYESFATDSVAAARERIRQSILAQ